MSFYYLIQIFIAKLQLVFKISYFFFCILDVFKIIFYLCTKILHQECLNAHQPASVHVVGSGGKAMRVRKIILHLTKCKRYGNQED